MTATPSEASILWMNGTLVPADDARLSPFDHGLTVGNGVFETMKVLADPSGSLQASPAAAVPTPALVRESLRACR